MALLWVGLVGYVSFRGETHVELFIKTIPDRMLPSPMFCHFAVTLVLLGEAVPKDALLSASLATVGEELGSIFVIRSLGMYFFMIMVGTPLKFRSAS